MCDFEKQGCHLIITIKIGLCVECVRKCIYCGLSNTVVYVHDIIVRYKIPQKHFRFTRSGGNLEILTSIEGSLTQPIVHLMGHNVDVERLVKTYVLLFSIPMR